MSTAQGDGRKASSRTTKHSFTPIGHRATSLKPTSSASFYTVLHTPCFTHSDHRDSRAQRGPRLSSTRYRTVSSKSARESLKAHEESDSIFQHRIHSRTSWCQSSPGSKRPLSSNADLYQGQVCPHHKTAPVLTKIAPPVTHRDRLRGLDHPKKARTNHVRDHITRKQPKLKFMHDSG